MLKQKKAQSTLEYVILVTAVIVVMITFLMGDNSPFRGQLKNTLEKSTDKMSTMTERWDGSI